MDQEQEKGNLPTKLIHFSVSPKTFPEPGKEGEHRAEGPRRHTLVLSANESVSAEEQLLVLAARLNLQEEVAHSMVSLLDRGIDWHKLLDDSERLGMHPLLFRHQSLPRFSRRVPNGVIETLQKGCELLAIRNIRLQACIDQILEVMQQSGILIILLKGAFLSRVVYRDIFLRPMSDIDILCRLEDLAVVREKLNSLGFIRPVGASRGFPFGEDETDPRYRHLPPLFKMEVSRIEVHWKLFGRKAPSPQEIQEMWAGAEYYPADGLQLPGLSPEYLLLHLCTHLHIHSLMSDATLYWFCDIHETILFLEHRIDWEALLLKADSIGEGAGVRAILLLLKKHWSSPVPDIPGEFERLALAEALRDRTGAGLVRFGKIQRLPVVFAMFKNAGRVGGRWSQIRLLLRFVFPNREYMLEAYPSAKRLWLWYAWRPLLLTFRAVESLLFIAAKNRRKS